MFLGLFKLSSPRPAETIPFVILLCLMPDDFTRQWRATGWERVDWAYLPILFLNLSSPRPAKTIPFVILLCLMPDDCTHQNNKFKINLTLSHQEALYGEPLGGKGLSLF